MNEELLPCPFCGSRNQIIEQMNGTIKTFKVLCDHCGASTGFTDKSATENWNQRAAIDNTRSLRYALAKQKLISEERREQMNELHAANMRLIDNLKNDA